MDYEKKYKDALEWARRVMEGKVGFVLDEVLEKFPELKESEDERIRKEIIDFLWKEKIFLQEAHSSVENNPKYRFVMDAITWLEKQGSQNLANSARTCKDEQKPIEWHREDEQNLNACLGYIPDECLRRWLTDAIYVKYDKPADKVEPKFHAGEWLCENEPNNYARFIQILEIVNVQDKDRYRISRDIYKDEDVVEFGFVEKYYHNFDIQDAKDGDVLATEDKNLATPFVAIYKGLRGNITFDSRCFIGFNGNFYTGEEGHAIEDIHPATKEQCDLLFAKMKEAGYEWDADKKKLKKIEQKPAWSEEDENILDNIIAYKYLNIDDLDWLKSLKERYALKPSDEQMKALDIAIRCGINPSTWEGDALRSLYEDLKKL